jgi:copper homeostasis protein
MGYLGRMPDRVKVEVCVTTLAEALAADRAGADRIEVCAWLGCGGITPSFGLLNFLQERIATPKRVLVRPRPGDFHYSTEDRQVLLRDVMMSGIGDKDCGIVTGALDTHGLPDHEVWKAVQLAANGRELTFHRAVDVSSDPLRSMEIVQLFGVQRLLTSGGARTAWDGRAVIADMVRRSEGRMTIAAAAGIAADNVVPLVDHTGVTEVHFSAQRFLENGTLEADAAKIEGVMNALVKAGMR